MPKQTVGEFIAFLKAAPSPIEELRKAVVTPEGRNLTEAAISSLGSMTNLATHLGCSHSSLGAAFRKCGFDYTSAPVPLAPTGDPLQYDVAYWKRRAERLEKENSELADMYANVGAVFSDLIKEFPPEPPVRPYVYVDKPGKTDEELSQIFVSDPHAGELVTKGHTSGLSEYNMDIFEQRERRYEEALDTIVNGHLRAVYPLRKAYVPFLGDNVAGESVFPKQWARIDRTAMYQMAEGAVHLARLLRYICGMYEEVWAYFIAGNHGANKDNTLNSDSILYLFMAMLLENQPNLHIVMSDSDLCGVYIDKSLGLLEWPKDAEDRTWNFLYTHGHAAQGWGGIPYYGLDRMSQRLQNSTGIVWDQVFCGHHHQPASTANWTLIGSWVGGTDFSVNRLQAASRPTQLLQGFHPKQGLTFQFPIYLDSAPSLNKQSEATPGMYTPSNELLDILRRR
jgi:hypothetical protein